MSTSNFIPEKWSTAILASLKKAHVFPALTNSDYEGEVAESGDVVRINTPGAVAVATYSGSVTYNPITSTQQALLIDQRAYSAIEIGDIDRAQANINLSTPYLVEMGYAFADEVDSDIAGLYTEAQHSVSLDVSSNTDGVRAALLEAGEDLDTANVPTAGRWLVVTPRVARAIKDIYGERATQLGDGVVRNGWIDRVEGFDVYMSNNVTVATQHKCLFGTNAAITLAMQIEPSVEALRLEDAFSDGLRALMVWGRKVVRPAALGVLNTTVA